MSHILHEECRFWDVEPCRYCVNRRLGGTYRLHLQGRKICERGTSVSRLLQPKRRFTQDLHGVTSQKTTFFIVTPVKTSDLTYSACSRMLSLMVRERINIPPPQNFKHFTSNASTDNTNSCDICRL
jgi:hypothetical protein